MIVSAPQLYPTLFHRSSVRSFTGEGLSPEEVAFLTEVCRAEVPLCPGVRLRLVTAGVAEVFPAPLFRGVPALIAVSGFPHLLPSPAALGYRGEEAVLAATAKGLGTCWVGGTYNRRAALRLIGLEEGEVLYAVIAVGHPARPRWAEKWLKVAVGASKRRPIEELLDPAGLSWAAMPAWARTALAAARLAPSAVNRQPWRFLVEERAITVKTAVGHRGPAATAAAVFDCGIAMFHLSLGAEWAGVKGEWAWRERPEVAKFSLVLS